MSIHNRTYLKALRAALADAQSACITVSQGCKELAENPDKLPHPVGVRVDPDKWLEEWGRKRDIMRSLAGEILKIQITINEEFGSRMPEIPVQFKPTEGKEDVKPV